MAPSSKSTQPSRVKAETNTKVEQQVKYETTNDVFRPPPMFSKKVTVQEASAHPKQAILSTTLPLVKTPSTTRMTALPTPPASASPSAPDVNVASLLGDSSDDEISTANVNRVSRPPIAKDKQPGLPTPSKANDACKAAKETPKPKSRKMLPSKDISPLIPGDSRVFSKQVGEHYMDGHIALNGLDKIYARPWDDCIPSAELSVENMPPFSVRLRDDQVGHLIDWILDKDRVSIPWYRANQYWPYDIEKSGYIANKRESWGKPYTGTKAYDALCGGVECPPYLTIGLPLTYTSSGKAMSRDVAEKEVDDGPNTKRKAETMLEEKTDAHGKRFCTWARPETREEVMETFINKIEALKTDHRIKNASLEAEIAALQREKEANWTKHQESITIKDSEIAGKNDSIAALQREKEDIWTKHQETISIKDSEIATLNAAISAEANEVTALETALTEHRLKTSKLETRSKRQDTELKKQRQFCHDERRLRVQIEEQKAKAGKQAKDAKTQVKSLEAVIEAKNEVLGKRNQRVSELEAEMERAWGPIRRCREVLEREIGGWEKVD